MYITFSIFRKCFRQKEGLCIANPAPSIVAGNRIIRVEKTGLTEKFLGKAGLSNIKT